MAPDPLNLYGGEFAPNAADNDSAGDDSAGDDLADNASTDEANDYHEKPDKFTMDIYTKATTDIKNIFSDNDNKKSMAHLEKLNWKIKKYNQDNDRSEDSCLIKIGIFTMVGLEARSAFKNLKRNPDNEKALEKLVKLDYQLLRTRKIHSYPSDWDLDIPTEIREKFPEIRQKMKRQEDEMRCRFKQAEPSPSASAKHQDKKAKPKHEWMTGQTIDTKTRLAQAQALIKELQTENTELHKRLRQSRAAALRCDHVFQEMICAVQKAERKFIRPSLIFADQSLH